MIARKATSADCKFSPDSAVSFSKVPVDCDDVNVMAINIIMATLEYKGNKSSSQSFWSTPQQIFMISQVLPTVANIAGSYLTYEN